MRNCYLSFAGDARCFLHDKFSVRCYGIPLLTIGTSRPGLFQKEGRPKVIESELLRRIVPILVFGLREPTAYHAAPTNRFVFPTLPDSTRAFCRMAEGMRSPAAFEIRRSQLIHSSQKHRLLRETELDVPIERCLSASEIFCSLKEALVVIENGGWIQHEAAPQRRSATGRLPPRPARTGRGPCRVVPFPAA